MKVRATLLILVISACGGSSPSGGDGAGDVHGDTGKDAGAAPPHDGGTTAIDASAPAPADAGSTDAAACAGACATVSGFVMRTSTKPTHGGKGNVYVAVFDQNPITNRATAKMVANVLIANQDMTADAAKVAYRIENVPPRASAYQVIAFLDDANAVTANNPQPASGDLVSLDLNGGFGGVPLSATAPGEVSLDLPLNVAMP